MFVSGNGSLVELGVPGAGQASKLVLLPSKNQTPAACLPTSGRRVGHRTDPAGTSGDLRVSAHLGHARQGRGSGRPQDRLGHSSAERLAIFGAGQGAEGRAAPRGAGKRAGAEPAMGLGHHEHQGVERGEGAVGGHHRLRGPLGAGVAVGPKDAFRRIAGDGSGSGVSALWGIEGKGRRVGVPIGQRAKFGVKSYSGYKALLFLNIPSLNS